MTRHYDTVIVGGGVTGTADLYDLTRYTTVGSIALIEKNGHVAEVNSHPLNNAQTSHDGGTETNFPLAKALPIQRAARILRKYLKSKSVPGLYQKNTRMVLGATKEEVLQLEERYEEFKPFFPDLRLIYGDELLEIEPEVMYGRNPKKPVCALVSKEGYAVNYQILAECFVKDSQNSPRPPELRFNTALSKVRKEDGWFVFTLKGEEEIRSRTAIFAAGAYSLLYAQELGYGLDLGILPVAGDFISAGRQVNGKVYRPQVDNRPFAELHLDRDVLDTEENHFGPTTLPQPLMERHRYGTFKDFLKLPIASFKGICILFYILFANNLVWYVAMNMLYQVPILGKYLLLRQARIIIPTLRYGDLKRRKGAGGIRPQIVNMTTWELEKGDKTIIGDNCIFNTTPSPGASVCLANAERDARQIVKFLNENWGTNHEFFEELYQEELGGNLELVEV